MRGAAGAIRASSSPRLDARLIVRHVLSLDEATLIAGETRRLSADEESALAAALARRVDGEPVAYITGVKEFWGLPIRCRAPTLLPRPDSETLVSAATARRPSERELSILDLGTGTGCLLAALLTAFPRSRGVGVDAHAGAVALAGENLAALGLETRGAVQQGNWADGLSGPFDLIVANPPYIPESERAFLSVDSLGYEDPGALFGGADGLSAYRTILQSAPTILSSSGLLIFELGAGQKGAVEALAVAAFPGAAISVDADLAGRPRALVVDRTEKTV